jgi:hypothetical protein
MSFKINELDKVEVANLRGSSQDYDLRYSEKTGKYTVADAFYHKHNMNNNGFTVRPHRAMQVLLMEVCPNDDAVMYKGRDGKKGKEFTANQLRPILDAFGFEGVNEFDLVKVEVEGAASTSTFFQVNAVGDSKTVKNEEKSEEDLEDGEAVPDIEAEQAPPTVEQEEVDEDDLLGGIL